MRPNHLAPIASLLEAGDTRPIRAIFNTPPRAGKTELVLHDIARYVKRYGSKSAAYCSYASTFSQSKALKAQQYMQAVHVAHDPRRCNLSEFRTTAGGGLLATSVGGPLTGQGVDRLYIDDPIKNRLDADSAASREAAWAWYEDVAETRLEPGASVFLFMTRWHPDDLAGRLIRERGLVEEGGEWHLVRIPALADGLSSTGEPVIGEDGRPKDCRLVDPLGRRLGEPIWPVRYDADYYKKIEANKPHTFASLYQGLPRDDTDKLFTGVQFFGANGSVVDPTTTEPVRAPYRVHVPRPNRVASGADLAFTQSKRADHSAWVSMCVGPRPVGWLPPTGKPDPGKGAQFYYITHVERWRRTFEWTLRHLKKLQQEHGGRIGVEANGPQSAIAQQLVTHGLKIYPFLPGHDKFARAQGFAEAWASGRVLLPIGAPWVKDYLNVLYDFTGVNDREDDLVDASVMAFDQLQRYTQRTTVGSFVMPNY